MMTLINYQYNLSYQTLDASYKTAKYLAKLLSPLSSSEYTVKSTEEFIKYIKQQKFEPNHKLISFVV